MTNAGGDMHTMTLEKGLATFLNTLSGKNRSSATIRAYATDIQQFISFLHENNVSIHYTYCISRRNFCGGTHLRVR
jgi:site-specific recombinase XerD